jgi:hypothetical protein
MMPTTRSVWSPGPSSVPTQEVASPNKLEKRARSAAHKVLVGLGNAFTGPCLAVSHVVQDLFPVRRSISFDRRAIHHSAALSPRPRPALNASDRSKASSRRVSSTTSSCCTVSVASTLLVWFLFRIRQQQAFAADRRFPIQSFGAFTVSLATTDRTQSGSRVKSYRFRRVVPGKRQCRGDPITPSLRCPTIVSYSGLDRLNDPIHHLAWLFGATLYRLHPESLFLQTEDHL